MKLAFTFLLLLLHYAMAAIGCYYVGDTMSKSTPVLFVLGGGFCISLIMISLIASTLQFILSLKKQIKQ